MKKVGIITFHFVENLGAVLQCAALTRVLSKLGYESLVIDYRPKYHTQKYSLFYKPFQTIKKEDTFSIKIKKLVKQLLLNIKVPIKIKKRKLFSSFLRENVRLTEKYTASEKLIATNDYLDACVAGSDQIWNSMYTDGKIDKAYLLNFFSGDKYSYAASAGKELQSEELDDIKNDLLKMERISVREKSLHNQLSEKSIHSELVLDPTLLLDKSEWNHIVQVKDGLKKKYILVYALEKSEGLNSIVEFAAKEYGIDVIDISPRNFLNVKTQAYRICGPKQFINLVRNASYIITNSFHGTVFSIIYEKKFWAIPHSKTPDRVIDLLELLGLNDRIVQKVEECNWEREVNYKNVKVLLEKKKEESLAFLRGI